MASRSQISRLASRIESLAGANASQVATSSIIRIPDGMDKEQVLARHRQRWPVNRHSRGPTLVVWVNIGAVHDARDDPAGSGEPSAYCDDISWREVASEEKPVCRASGGNAQD
jgi:hypothetical protein